MRESPISRISGLSSVHRHNRWRNWRCRAALLAALVAMAPPAAAQDDYESGKRAYLAGDYAEAVRIWQPLADEGNKFAQFSLGSLYFEGSGVEQSMEISVTWFRLAADQDYAPAQFNLGNAYKNGDGVAKNDLEAAEWWRKAAQQDFAPAQFNLATQYYFGRGVPKDEEIAIQWYRRAAENGHVQAQRLFSMTDSPAGQAQAGSAEPAATSTASGDSAAPALAAAAATGSAAASSSTTTGGKAAGTPLASPAAAPVASAAAGSGSNESWLLSQNPEDYTLQLLATHSEDLLRAYLDKHQFTEPVAYFAFQRDGKQWYAAVHGAYPGKSQAQTAVATLPPEVGKSPPWIRQFSSIHELIKAP